MKRFDQAVSNIGSLCKQRRDRQYETPIEMRRNQVSLQEFEINYEALKTKRPGKTEVISRLDLYPFLQALGDFGRSLASVGLYANLERDAERFSAWLREQRDPYEPDLAGIVLGSFARPDEDVFANIPDPILNNWEFGAWCLAEFLRDCQLRIENPIGCYLLHLASFVRDAEARGRRLFEELVDCFELDPPLLTSFALKAANEFLWETRKRLADEDRSGADQANISDGPSRDETVNSEEQIAQYALSNEGAGENWGYHEHGEQPPVRWFVSESLQGTLDELLMLLKTTGGPDAQRISCPVRNERIWVRRISDEQWEVFFRDEKTYICNAARLEEWRNKSNLEMNRDPTAPGGDAYYTGRSQADTTDSNLRESDNNLTFKSWADFAIGIDENCKIWLFSPAPFEGENVFPNKASELKLGGNRWLKVLKSFASSEDGKSASQAQLITALRFVEVGAVTAAAAFYDDKLRSQAKRAPRRLREAMADLSRQFRNLVTAPTTRVFESEGQFYRSPFVVRHLIRDEQNQVCFRRR